MLYTHYVCHTRYEDEEVGVLNPVLLTWVPPRPTAEELEKRRALLARAHKGKARELRALAEDYRLLLPLVMPTLTASLRATLTELVGRPPKNGGPPCRS